MVYVEAFSKVLPVILLFLLGFILKRRQFFRPDSLADLKKVVLNLALPSALFLAFLQVNLEVRYLLIVASVFAACVVMLIVSSRARARLHVPSPFFPMLMTGFEAGMLGYAIFGAVYGVDNLYKFGLIDLGQVTFVFFVLVTVLARTQQQILSPRAVLLNFVKTPVIIAIGLGIIANAIGLGTQLEASPVLGSLLRTLELIAALTTPLIAIVIGYETQLDRSALGWPLRTVALRTGAWLIFGLIFNVLVIDGLLQLDRVFQAAVLTMMVLPPPFVIPLFIQQSAETDRAYVVNTLSLGTVVTLFAFAVISVVYAV
jgi:predicted permease